MNDAPDAPTGSFDQDGAALELLERFARGELEGDSLDALRDRLARDPALAAMLEEVRANRATEHMLRETLSPVDEPAPGLPSIEGYAVRRELHRGGQGIVYAGVQTSTGRGVAIKVLLRGGLSTARQRARFDREIALLASLDHPGIVAVIDRARTGDGRAALVMELIQGVPIDRFARDEATALRARLELFAELGEIVGDAHRRGIIHRDLKPGNVLVDREGRPRVLDFGLAKSIGEDGPAELGVPIGATLEGEFVGTLAYAAPEQFDRGSAAADTRSDVYALGAMLYEVLVGRPPIDASGPIGAAVARIREQSPPRPSALGVALPRDVEIVVMTALERDPQRRYDSASALADELRRCLRDEPIAARPPSAAYLLGKFARRNPWLVAACLIAFAAPATIAPVVSVSLIRTNAARKNESAALARAGAEADKQARLNAFLRRMLTAVDPGRSGPEMRVVELIDDAAGRIDDEFEGYPVLRATTHATLAETAWRLGEIERATDQIERAIALLRGSDDPQAPRELAMSLTVLAGIHLTGQHGAPAEKAIREAREIADRDAIHDPLLRAKIEVNAGGAALLAGDATRALAAFDETETRLAGLPGAEPEQVRLQALTSRGVALTRLDRHGEALDLYEQILPRLVALRGPEHPDTLACRANRGGALLAVGRREEALSEMRELLEIRRRVFGPSHERVALAANNLADTLRQVGEYARAAGYYEEALRIYTDALGERNMRVAMVTHNLGVLYLESGRPERGEPYLARASELLHEVLPPGHWVTAQGDLRLGEAMLELGRPGEAAPLVRDAYERLVRALGEDHSRTTRARELLERLEIEP